MSLNDLSSIPTRSPQLFIRPSGIIYRFYTFLTTNGTSKFLVSAFMFQ